MFLIFSYFMIQFIYIVIVKVTSICAKFEKY